MVNRIKYLIIDVDGTLTDGGVYYDECGNELKKFNTRDAAGFFCAHHVNIKTIILTGRECMATARRAKELDVDILQQNIRNKVEWLKKYMETEGIMREEIAYIGDDLNDLNAMKLVGYVGCPKDAFPEIKEIANYVSTVPGGKGAVRNFVEHILKERNQWDKAYKSTYGGV